MQRMIMTNWTLKNIISLFRQNISELDLDMFEGSQWSSLRYQPQSGTDLA